MPYVDVGSAKLWYEDTGSDATPVVLLHPYTGNTEGWIYQLPVFTAAGYRCITYDRRGWGKSHNGSPGPEKTYATDDLHALVEHLGLPRYHRVSSGGGGYVALDHTVSHPEELLSLVVACSGGPLQNDPEYMAIGSKYGRILGFQSLPAWFRELGPTYRNADPDGVDRWVEIEEASRQEESSQEGIKNAFTLDLLATIQVPTLMIAGSADLYAAPPRMRAMASRIPDCRFALMPEAGHAAFWEQPEQWNELVLDFIRDH